MVRFCTINVNGLRDESKRVRVFQQLRKSGYDVIALQETHCSTEVVSNWKEQWGGTSFWTQGETNSAGVAFLFNPKHKVVIKDIYESVPGRLLRLTIKFNNIHLQLVNVYGYNTHSTPKDKVENFFYLVNQSFSYDPLAIVLGDFNMVESVELDRQGGIPANYHTYGLVNLTDMKEQADLIDSWRSLHPNDKVFTYSNHDGSIKSRLDRIYIPIELRDQVINTFVMPTQLSDHDFVILNVTLPNEVIRGKGKWSFNVEYLQHEEFEKRVIDFWNDWRVNHKRKFKDKREWYDMGKFHLKSIAIQYAADLHEATKILFSELRERLKIAMQCNSTTEEIDEIRDEISNLEYEKAKKIFILTQTAVKDSGEKPTKYFYSLLKKRQALNTMDYLEKEDGTILDKPQDMLNEAHNFFQKLFTKEEKLDEEEQKFFLSKIKKKISNVQRQNLEKKLDEKDLYVAAFSTNTGTSSGHDGFPYEFWTHFWNLFGKDMLDVANASLYELGATPKSLRKSYIILTFKKGAKEKLYNWRPISLLCCDYKIMAKALANKLKLVLSTILHDSQTANVPGRTVFHNGYTVRDTLEYCRRRKVNGYLISFDQEKAFDKVDRDFLYKILETMNFGPMFIQAIKALYSDANAHVLVNGFISVLIVLERSLKQGGPLSSMLYAIYTEVLALAVRDDKKIVGIKLPGGKEVISVHFADDAEYFLAATTLLADLFDMFRRFKCATGSTINKSKTQGLTLGIPNFDDPDLHKVEWMNMKGGLKILGIFYFTKYEKTRKKNWEIQIERLKEAVSGMEKRNLSYKGKVLVLNTVALAKIWYVATVLSMNTDYETQIKTIIFNYLWKGFKQHQTSHPKISYDMSYQPKEKGGLNIKSPVMQQNALQLKFIKPMTDQSDNSQWLILPRYWLGFYLGTKKPEWNFLINTGPTLQTPLTPQIRHTVRWDLDQSNHRPLYYHNLYVQMVNIDYQNTTWLTPDIYKESCKKIYKFPDAWSTYWNRLTGCYHPGKMWKLVYHTYADGHEQDIHFLFLHRKVSTKMLIKQNKGRGLNYNAMSTICSSCKISDEDQEHLFMECVEAQKLWDFVLPTLRELLKPHEFRIYDLILNKFPKVFHFKQLIALTLIQITMRTIWLNRNSFRFDPISKKPSLVKSQRIIMKNFFRAINRQFEELLPNQLAKFRKRFCHTPKVIWLEKDDVLFCNILRTGQG